MEQDSQPRLPRSAQDPDNLRRLRQEALKRLEEEERLSPAVIYGGPPLLPDRPVREDREPAPVYGGPPIDGGGSVTRRGILWALLLAALAALGAVAVWLFKKHGAPPVVPQAGPPAAVYGGPPPPQPPKRDPAPVYGGPPTRPHK